MHIYSNIFSWFCRKTCTFHDLLLENQPCQRCSPRLHIRFPSTHLFSVWRAQSNTLIPHLPLVPPRPLFSTPYVDHSGLKHSCHAGCFPQHFAEMKCFNFGTNMCAQSWCRISTASKNVVMWSFWSNAPVLGYQKESLIAFTYSSSRECIHSPTSFCSAPGKHVWCRGVSKATMSIWRIIRTLHASFRMILWFTLFIDCFFLATSPHSCRFVVRWVPENDAPFHYAFFLSDGLCWEVAGPMSFISPTKGLKDIIQVVSEARVVVSVNMKLQNLFRKAEDLFLVFFELFPDATY